MYSFIVILCVNTRTSMINTNVFFDCTGFQVWSTTALVVESYTTTHFLTDTLVLPSKQQIGWEYIIFGKLFSFRSINRGFICLTLFLKILFLNRMCVSPNRGGGGTMQLDDCLHMHQTSRTKNEQEFGYAVWLSQNIVFDRAGNRYVSWFWGLGRGVFVVVSLSLFFPPFLW